MLVTLSPSDARFQSLDPDEPAPVHISPRWDFLAHRDGLDCPCRPSVARTLAGGLVVIHRAWIPDDDWHAAVAIDA